MHPPVTDSLGGRLTLAAAVVLAAFLGLAGIALDRAFRRSVEEAVHERLQVQIYLLLGAAELDDQGRLDMPADVAEPRLGTPDSGLYAAVRDAAGHVLWRSESSVGRDIAYPVAGAPGDATYARVDAGGDELHALTYPVTWEQPSRSDYGLAFQVAESVADAEARVATFRRTLWLWLAGIAVLLLAALVLVLRWGLRPLRRVAGEIAEIERGERTRLGGDYPRELRPLTDNLNGLIAGGRARLQRYRDALADLAHSLKTPIAVLRALGDEGDRSAAIREQTERMERTLGWHLQRAAAAGRSGLQRAVPVADTARRLLRSLDTVHARRAPAAELDIPEATAFVGDPDDLMEMLGNLLDNAYKWCRQRVRITARADQAGTLTLEVADDGCGIPPARRAAVLERGVRMDEQTPGEGIGLALVRQMVEDAYGGRISLDASDLGGLAVRVTLPADDTAASRRS